MKILRIPNSLQSLTRRPRTEIPPQVYKERRTHLLLLRYHDIPLPLFPRRWN
jgi:hypothetical protein